LHISFLRLLSQSVLSIKRCNVASSNVESSVINDGDVKDYDTSLYICLPSALGSLRISISFIMADSLLLWKPFSPNIDAPNTMSDLTGNATRSSDTTWRYYRQMQSRADIALSRKQLERTISYCCINASARALFDTVLNAISLDISTWKSSSDQPTMHSTMSNWLRKSYILPFDRANVGYIGDACWPHGNKYR